MFRERWYLGAVAALLAGAGLVFFQINQPKMYQTTSTLIFENPQQILDIAPVFNSDAGGIDLRSHLAQIRSASFKRTVIATFTPEEVETIRRKYMDPELPEDRQVTIDDIVSGAITVEPIKGSPIIAFTTRSRDPDAAEMIANRFARRYIDYNLERAASGTTTALVFLEDEERKARQKMEEAQAKLTEYRQIHNTVSLEDDQNLVVARLTDIARQLTAAKAESGQIETSLRQVETYEAEGKDLLDIEYIASYRSIPSLVKTLETLAAEKSVLDDRYLENHPKVKANALAYESASAQLQSNISQAVIELQNRHARSKQMVERLIAEEETAAQAALDLDGISGGYETLREQAEQAKETYAQVYRRYNETILTARLDNVNIKILDRAWFPAEPYFPKEEHIVIQAVVVGAILFIGIPLVVGLLDSRLKAAWEIEQFLGQNLLGEIPSISGISRKERPHIMAKELDHSASEAFRGLFGQFQLNSTVDYPKSILFTSTLPGEGKSMIVNNIAATFASHGKRTLLVDADFRRPNLHLFYGKDNACGMVRWLNSGEPINGPVEDDPDLGILPLKENLFLLRAGGESRRATELFGLHGFVSLMKVLRSQFDVVIIDTPPLGVFPDAMLLSSQCDEAVYICRFNTVNRAKIRKTLERLVGSEATLSGIVLNGIPTGSQSAYYDYYGYGANESKKYKAYYSKKR